MLSERDRWPTYYQAAALIIGGIVIMVAATLTWIAPWSGLAGTYLIEGKITFVLGAVSVVLGRLLFGRPDSRTIAIVTGLGLWLSLSVIMLALGVSREIAALENSGVLSFVHPDSGRGVLLTICGGIITGAGSVYGMILALRRPSVRRLLEPRAIQVGALFVGGLVIAAGTALRWQEIGFVDPVGVDFASGKIAFALSGVAVLLATYFATGEERLARPMLTVLGSWLAGAVIMLAFAESFSITSEPASLAESSSNNSESVFVDFRLPAVAFGLILTVIGGSVAAVGSLAGLASGPRIRTSSDLRGAAPLRGPDEVDDHMPSERHRWPDVLQPAALLTGGILIMVAATLTWSTFYPPGGTAVVEGKISFALGVVALVLGGILVGQPDPRTRAVANGLGLWISLSVILLALSVSREIEASHSLLGFLQAEEGRGILLTICGGAVCGGGSVFGILQGLPDQSLGRLFNVRKLARLLKSDSFQVGALFVGGLVIAAGAALR